MSTLRRISAPLALIPLFGLFGALLPVLAVADTITLKNGDVIEGKIVSKDDKEIVIQIGKTGRITFTMDRIEKIVEDNKTGSSHGKTGVKGRKIPPKPEKKLEPRKPRKPQPKKTPEIPAADNPYIDKSPPNPAISQRATQQIQRLRMRPRFKNRARNALRQMGKEAGRALIRGLRDESPKARREVAMLLGGIEYMPAVPYLIHNSLDDDDVGVRAAAAETLRKLTKKSLRYFPESLPRLRKGAVQRWKDWWAVEARRYGMKP
ncbi:MAG: HEAT repeat domain-containing protein [Planctomycetota bacterium]|nr:HEAT repeat domain-containing protein [Planctomycetota bacterium]